MLALAAGVATTRASASSAGDCSCKKCIGNFVFSSGYIASMAGIGCGLLNLNTTMAGISAVNCMAGAAGHFLWSQLAGIDATGEVNEAAQGARAAAGSMQEAASSGAQLALRVSMAAHKVEEGAVKIQSAIGSGMSNEVASSATEIQVFSQRLTLETQTMKDQLHSLKGVLNPLMIIAESLRKELREIRRESIVAAASIKKLDSIEQEFNTARMLMSANLVEQADGLKMTIDSFSETAVCTLGILKDNNQVLLDVLREKSEGLTQALADLTQVTEVVSSSQQAREELIRQLGSLEAENLALQREMRSVIERVTGEREGWRLGSEQSQSYLQSTTASIEVGQQKIGSFTEKLQMILDRFQAPPVASFIERESGL